MSDDKPKDDRSPEEIKADIATHREELGESLDALTHKLDVPARAKEQTAAMKDHAVAQTIAFKDSAAQQPARTGAMAGGAAVAVVAAIMLLRTRKK